MSNYPMFKARLVQGSFFELKTKDYENKPLEETKYHWYVGLAIPKGPEWDALFNVMKQVAMVDETGAVLCSQPGFNWKTEDCDSPDNPENKGKESYPAGCMILKLNRNVKMGPIPLVDGNHTTIINKESIKRGDYFYISASTKFNGAKTIKTNAGMYQNIMGAMFAEAGEELGSSAPQFDAASAFAGVQGATVANAGVSQEGAPVAAKPPVTAKPPVLPAHDLVKPQPPVKKYNVEGTEYTGAELLGFGWTQSQIDAL